MPRDFKSFTKENQNQSNNTENLSQDKTQEYQDIINKYKDMNSNELMSNLFSEASKLKSEGKLDENSLNQLSNTLSPFLNLEQKQMLSNLVKAINEQK